MRLKDKIALVTGAGTGLGKAIAVKFASEGAQVALCGRRRTLLDGTYAEIARTGGNALVLPGDVTIESDVRRVIQGTVDHFGRLDVLVNNAGVNAARGPVTEISEEGLRRTLDGNLISTFLCCKYALPELIKTQGNIVNMASLVGLRGAPNLAAYGAAKGAVVLLTKDMAVDYASRGVRVNCICPAYVETEMTRGLLAELKQTGGYDDLVKMHPLGFIGSPEDVAYGALYLASEEARWVSGIALNIDGGITATR